MIPLVIKNYRGKVACTYVLEKCDRLLKSSLALRADENDAAPPGLKNVSCRSGFMTEMNFGIDSDAARKTALEILSGLANETIIITRDHNYDPEFVIEG